MACRFRWAASRSPCAFTSALRLVRTSSCVPPRLMAWLSASAPLSWAWARAACARASASSSCSSSWPAFTHAPCSTSTRLTVVAVGACASTLLMGSILPLVEMLAVMVSWSVCATRTGTRARRKDMKAASTTTAKMRPARMIHVSLPLPRLLRPFSDVSTMDIQTHKYNAPKQPLSCGEPQGYTELPSLIPEPAQSSPPGIPI